jgi:hypothetical protein
LNPKEGRFYGGKILPSLIENPITAISKDMFNVINQCGGADMDTFKAEIKNNDKLVSDNYLDFKLYTFISKQELNSDLNALEKNGKTILFFKIQGDYTSLYIHEKLKKALEEAKLPRLRFHNVEDSQG